VCVAVVAGCAGAGMGFLWLILVEIQLVESWDVRDG